MCLPFLLGYTCCQPRIAIQPKKRAERKTNLDSRCRLKAERGGISPTVVKQEKRDAWTNAASRSDAEYDIDAIKRGL
jgi:hypothetical protein